MEAISGTIPTTPPPRLTRCALAALLVSAGAGGCAGGPRALPPGARVVGSQAKEARQVATVDALGGFLGAGYLFTDQAIGEAQERTEHLFQERAGLGLSGSVYSPEFLLYEATGVLGLSQDLASDRSGSFSDTGELYEADVSASIFPKRFHPAHLSFTKIDNLQPQVFFSKIDTRTTTARGVQTLRLRDANLQFEASRRELDQTVFGGQVEPFVEVTEDNLGASGSYRLAAGQTVDTSYNYQNVRQATAQNSFSAHRAIGNHTWNFGRDKGDLRSRVETVFQDGDLDQELLRLNEMFHYAITESLRTDAELRAERNDTNLVGLEELRGSGSLSHQLFQSLSSSLRFQGGRLISDGQSTTDTIAGGVNLGYRKKTPLGRFRLSYSNLLERRIVENDRGGAVDEPHTFPATPPEEVVLVRVGIDPASIVVTNPTGLVFYRLDRDYTVSQDAGGLTRLTRVFTGTIPQGGDILVDYTFQQAADFTLDTLSQNARMEHQFHGGLTPYVALLHQDQNVSDFVGAGEAKPVRELSLLGGLEWRRPEYLVGAEYEHRKSTVLPFDAVRLRAQGSARFAERHQLTGTATQAWLFYREPERDVSITQAIARWNSRVGRRTTIRLDTAVRYDDDSIQGSSFGYAVTGELEYLWRRFRIRLRVAHRENRGTNSDFRGDEVGIWIVRTFGSPPPTTSAAIDRFLRQ